MQLEILGAFQISSAPSSYNITISFHPCYFRSKIILTVKDFYNNTFTHNLELPKLVGFYEVNKNKRTCIWTDNGQSQIHSQKPTIHFHLQSSHQRF